MPIVIPGSVAPAVPGTLAPGYYQKPFPTPGVSVPSLAPYQLWYNGLTMGPGTALEFTKIEGLDQPDVRSGDAARARDHGLFIGLDLLGGRTVTVTAELGPVAGSTFTQSWANLAAATVPSTGNVESPLYLNLPSFGTLVSMARVRRRNMPIDITFALGNLAQVSLQWNATDPRLYSTPTLNPSVSPPGTTAGFTFPLSFPLSFGGGGVAGSISVINNGDIDCRPLLVVTGPCTNPSIALASAPNTPILAWNLTMASGDQLVIDTDMHTATYYVSGSTIGASRLGSQKQGNQWFSLPPGTSTLQFLTGDSVATGTLTVEYCSAYVL